MTKFLLILVLFYPDTQQYIEKVGMFDTLKQCQETKIKAQSSLRGAPPTTHFVLTCVKGTPTNLIQG